MNKKICMILGIAVSAQSAHALTPQEYCKTIPKTACEVLNVEPVMMNVSTLGNATGAVRVPFGGTISGANQTVTGGVFEISGTSTYYTVYPSYVHAGTPVPLSYKVKVGGVEIPSSGGCGIIPELEATMKKGMLPSASKTLFPHSGTGTGCEIAFDKAKCVSESGCSVNPMGLMGTVPLLKKVCQNGQFKVMLKIQPVTDAETSISVNDCTH